jgi:hypothetical protein
MSTDSEPKQFLACITCGNVVMRTPMEQKKSTSDNKHQLRVTLCRGCDGTIKIRKSGPGSKGVVMSINKRMVETWYVYTALTKLVDGDVDIVCEHNESGVSLINRDDFINPETYYGYGAKPTTINYELTTVMIPPDNPENASAQTCPRLITGFF